MHMLILILPLKRHSALPAWQGAVRCTRIKIQSLLGVVSEVPVRNVPVVVRVRGEFNVLVA